MVTQILLALFGLTGAWMAMGGSARQRRWAPIVALAGQPAWAAFAWQTQAPGLAVVVAAFTVVYLRGAWVQWRRS